jgi:uncharacterized protein with HEPN domain
VIWSPQPHFELILDALDHIDLYRPATEAEFFASPLVQDGIVLRLPVIGEHLHQMREQDAERFDRVADRSWHQVIGLRHRISHGYHTVDRAAIWQIVSEEIADFRRSIEDAVDTY